MLHAVRYGSEYFVRDCTDLFSEIYNRRVFSENNNRITFLYIYATHIYHCQVHTNIADNRYCMAIYHNIPPHSIAKLAAKPVGISNANSSNCGIMVEMAFTPIAYRFSGFYMLYLQNGCF